MMMMMKAVLVLTTVASGRTEVLLKDPFKANDAILFDPTDDRGPYRHESVPYIHERNGYPNWDYVPATNGDSIVTSHFPNYVQEIAHPFKGTWEPTIFGTFDHCKKVTGTEPYDVSVGSSIRVEWQGKCQQLNVTKHPFNSLKRGAVTNPNADLRLGFCSIELFDTKTSTFHTFAVTNDVVYAFYERLPEIMFAVETDATHPAGSATCPEHPLNEPRPKNVSLIHPPTGVYCPPFYSYTTAKKVYTKRSPEEKLKVAIELTRHEDRSEMNWFFYPPKADGTFEKTPRRVLGVPMIGMLPKDEPKLGMLCERNGDPDDEKANKLDLDSIRVGLNLLNAHDFGDIVKITDLLEDPSIPNTMRSVMDQTNLGLQKLSTLRDLYTYPTKFVDEDSLSENRLFGAGAVLEMHHLKVIKKHPAEECPPEEEEDDTEDLAKTHKPCYAANDLIDNRFRFGRPPA